MLTRLFPVIVLCLSCQAALAVDRLVPQQYSTIQAAVSACQQGDRVLVDAGTYAGPVNLGALDLELVALHGPAHTTITGTASAPVITMPSGTVDGFRISGGTTSVNPPISCSPTFGFRSGGGFYATGGTIKNCHIVGNRGDGSPTNDAVGHGITINGVVTVQDCIIEQNGGSGCCPSSFGRVVAAGVFVHGSGVLERCLIRGNYANRAAGIKVGHCGLTGGSAVLRECVIYGNTADNCAQAENHFGTLVLENSHVYGSVCGSASLVGNSAIWTSMQDCNGNGLPDTWECLSGAEVDVNRNLVPDTCECVADIFPDGQVNGGDLGVVLAQWGVAAPSAAGDVIRDGVVDGQDLAYVLSGWGPCP